MLQSIKESASIARAIEQPKEQTAKFVVDLHDAMQQRGNPVAGFDLVTGWGSPKGPALISALTQ